MVRSHGRCLTFNTEWRIRVSRLFYKVFLLLDYLTSRL